MMGDAREQVAARTMSQAQCRELETVLGLNWNPDGLLASAALAAHVDPIAACTYDWVHNMLQDRMHCVCMNCLLGAL